MKQIQNVRAVQSIKIGTPHMENCSQYSGSTIHIYMNVEPPIQRTASKVYLFIFDCKALNLKTHTSDSVGTKCNTDRKEHGVAVTF